MKNECDNRYKFVLSDTVCFFYIPLYIRKPWLNKCRKIIIDIYEGMKIITKRMDTMDMIKTFGGILQNMTAGNPEGARRMLLTGYRARRLALSLRPDSKLPASRQYAARAVMDSVIRALAHPENAAMVSIFVPCEPLAAAGITPYSVETLSGYLPSHRRGRRYRQISGNDGAYAGIKA